jgi:3-oxoacyl-[acyl-carrier protein] reductase
VGGDFIDVSGNAWAESIYALRSATLAASRKAASLLAADRPGRIIFVVTTGALRPVSGGVLRAVAGAFLTTLGQVGAIELGARGITVNAVVVGCTSENAGDEWVAGVPAGRLAALEEVAGVVGFVASATAGYINGAVIPVDGGFSITKADGGSPWSREKAHASVSADQ